MEEQNDSKIEAIRDEFSTSVGEEEEEQFVLEQEEERDERKEIHKLAQTETTRVWIWRGVLLIIILLAAAVVTAGTFLVLQDGEQDDFETSYDLFANTVMDGVNYHRENLRLAAIGFSNVISGAAAGYGSEYPYVTLPDFEVMGQSARGQSGMELVIWSPYVKYTEANNWLDYSVKNSPQWIALSRETALTASPDTIQSTDYRNNTVLPFMFGLPEEGDENTLVSPIWQMSPPPFSNTVLNANLFAIIGATFPAAMTTLNHGVLGDVRDLSFVGGSGLKEENHEAYHQSLVDWRKEDTNSTWEHPHSILLEPVYQKVNDPTSGNVGILTATIGWDAYLVDLLPEGVDGILVVLKNTCNQSFSYELSGNGAFYQGAFDNHNPKYDKYEEVAAFYSFDDIDVATETPGHCIYSFHIYPTETFEDEYKSELPVILAVVVGSTFVFMLLSFMIYDWFVQRRNRKVVSAAAQANSVVASMFPAEIKEKLLQQKKQEQEAKDSMAAWKNKSFFPEDQKTIADFYPETTILFADIVGFTAWSSVREPHMVFDLLETLYKSLDDAAKSRRIFKVETVGDCYVAVAGLPEARKDHAVAMCRFARDCMHRMQRVVRNLEKSLGPDTGDLTMRIGLHSGPVTAGVLRGERTRFQLFGDTMNTASRMESTSRPGYIQISNDTASLLKEAGKDAWLALRNDAAKVKGKGEMQTYWLVDSRTSGTESTGNASSRTDESEVSLSPSLYLEKLSAKMERLVDWNVEVMMKLIKQIQARNGSMGNLPPRKKSLSNKKINCTPLEEVVEVIALPDYEDKDVQDADKVVIDDKVRDQLRKFVATIASLYRDNAFHSFEHASHVTMAAVKLLSRVTNPKVDDVLQEDADGPKESLLHDYTYGITSDPITQFACVFSALIHDLDHHGVPNVTLIKEDSVLAKCYKRSVLEQNSFDLAWNLFTDDNFKLLRSNIFKTDQDQARFRQIVVNMVMATDVMDKELNQFRNQRWQKAFGDQSSQESESEKDQQNRKATIVIEHLIQASDVAHTMQHWHVFRKWNSRLFIEMYEAFMDGRSDKNPSDNWYEGELGFFDFYIIPLAKKLAECGVFGVSSPEYLSYAERNRKEWEERGKELVAEYVEEAHQYLARKKKMAGERQVPTPAQRQLPEAPPETITLAI